ncbi:MAG: protein kinase [Planctomycetota bacterium]
MLSHDKDPQEGRKRQQPIPGYELMKKLGEGGMAATYLARQTSMDRLVAIKIMRKSLARDASFISRFEREAKLAGSLNHVNIVGVHDVGEGGGFHYLTMEYVEGRSLQAMLDESGALEEGFALHLAMQVARALGFAHKAGIIHRDIKPDNILVTGKGIAKLCDFGLARSTGAETRMTQTGVMMGTPHYVSPEQARGEKDLDIRTDIYSLGATLYHLVTGQTPFQGSSAAVVMTKHLTEQVPWPADVNPTVSENCCRLVERMMAKEREDRYQDSAELLRDMERVIDGKAPESVVLEVGRSSIGRRGQSDVKPLAPRRRPGRHQEDAGTAGLLLEPGGGGRLADGARGSSGGSRAPGCAAGGLAGGARRRTGPEADRRSARGRRGERLAGACVARGQGGAFPRGSLGASRRAGGVRGAPRGDGVRAREGRRDRTAEGPCRGGSGRACQAAAFG